MAPRGNGRGRGRGQHAPSYRMEITPPMPPITRIQTTLTPLTPTANPPGSRGRASQAGSSSSNAATPLSLEALLNAPARRNQPVLHPKKVDGALWFGIDPEVNKTVRTTWQSNYMGAWWNRSMVPDAKAEEWWQDFVQAYYWSPSHHDQVYFMWKKECMESIRDRVSKKKRDNKKPSFISDDAWLQMQEQWDTDVCQKKSKTNSENRMSDPHGLGEHKHCDGPVGFAKIGYEMMQQNGGVEPPFTELVRKTHTRKDGTFVDRRAEAIVADVETAASQVTDEEEATPSSQRINKAYLERVKPNRGRIYGLGSKQFEVFEPSEPVAASLSRAVDMDMRVGSLESNVQAILASQSLMLASQKAILDHLGINPQPNNPYATPSPHAAASNTTPNTSPEFAPSVNREYKLGENDQDQGREDDQLGEEQSHEEEEEEVRLG